MLQVCTCQFSLQSPGSPDSNVNVCVAAFLYSSAYKSKCSSGLATGSASPIPSSKAQNMEHNIFQYQKTTYKYVWDQRMDALKKSFPYYTYIMFMNLIWNTTI